MVHLAPNCSAAGSLRQAFPNAQVYSAMDALSCGPAREFALQPADAWFSDRAAFWEPIHPPAESVEERSRILEAFRGEHDSACAVWAGSTADDQLFLAWVCAVAPLFGNTHIHWVDCSDPSSRFPFASVSVHNADFLRKAPPPRLLSPQEIAFYAGAWSAWAAASPRALLDFIELHRDTTAGLALSHLLNRYPLSGFGINGPELLLLKNIRQRGPRLAHAIGWSLGDRMDESADWFGDGWLFWRAQRLASHALARPLIEFTGDPARIQHCNARLTPAGHAVLEGGVDALLLNGVEDHVGGVTLSSARGDVWVRTENGLERV